MKRAYWEYWRTIFLVTVGLLAAATILCMASFGPVRGLLIGAALTAILFGFFFMAIPAQWIGGLIFVAGRSLGARLGGMTIYRVSVVGKTIYCRAPYRMNNTENQVAQDTSVIASKKGVKVLDIALYVLMGPIFSLAAAYGLYRLPRQVPWFQEASPIGPVAGLMFLALAIGTLVVPLMPYFMKQDESDYAAIKMLLLQPKAMLAAYERNHALLQLYDKRPRDFSPEVIETLGSEKAWGHVGNLYGYYRAFDAGDLDEAEKQISAAYRTVTDGQLEDYYCAGICFEMAMFASRFLADKELSDAAFKRGAGINRRESSRGMAVAARLYARGRVNWAIAVAEASVREYWAETRDDETVQPYVLEWTKRVIPELPEITSKAAQRS